MYSLIFASRYLKSRKESSITSIAIWLSFLGIAIGVAALIIVTSVMNGFRHDLINKYSVARGHMRCISKSSDNIQQYNSVIKKITNTKNVRSAIGIIEQRALIMNDNTTRSILMIGISRDSLKEKYFISNHLIDCSINDFDKSIFIGERLANTLFLQPGDDIVLLVPNAINTPFGPSHREETFRIGGVFRTGLYEYDLNCILMPLNMMQRFLDIGDSITHIEILLHNESKLNNTALDVLNKHYNDLKVLTYSDSESRGIFQVLKVQKNIMSIILFIIILVAAFNIVSSLTMLSNSKSRDIAILRSVGASKNGILFIFLFIGCFIGIGGSIIGVCSGLILAKNIGDIQQWLETKFNTQFFNDDYFISSKLPCKIDLINVSSITFLAIFICLLAAIYPAIKCSKVDPVRILKS